MKGYEQKASFSSPPIKSSASPKGSDENNRGNQEKGLSLHNPKKHQTVKNFMSPTVSTVSKASFPRKKILAERNESPGASNSFDTHLSKSPNLDSKSSAKTIPKASLKNSPNLDPKLTSKDPSSQKTPSSYNSRDETPSPRPYDPLTNYLSPRPQFLRYNPNRRKEILLRLEMEDKEGDDGSSVSSSISSFDPKKAGGDEVDTVSSDNSSSLQEDEEFDVEIDEEDEEETGWSLRGVLKYMFLLVLLLLTTLYISSMNSPTPALGFQGFPVGYQPIQNHSYGTVESVEFGYNFFDGKHARLGLLGLNHAIVGEGIEQEMAKNVMEGTVSLVPEDRNVESVEMVEEVQKDRRNEDACDEELIKGGEDPDKFVEDVDLHEKETVEKIEEVEKAENVEETGESEDASEDELVKKVPDQLVEDIELQEGEESGEHVKETGEGQYVIVEELVKIEEVFDQLVEDIKLLGREETGERIENVEKVEDVKESGEIQDIIEEELVEAGIGQGALAGLLLSEETEHLEASSRTTDSSEKERMVTIEEGEETHEETTVDGMIQGKITRFENSIYMNDLLSEATELLEASSRTTDSSEKERMVTREEGEETHEETRVNGMIQGKITRFGNSISIRSAVSMLERWGKFITLNFEQVNPLKGLKQKNMGSEMLPIVIIVFLTCAAIVASVVLGSNIRRMEKASKHSLLDKHLTEPVIKEKPSLVLPGERGENKTHVNSFMNTKPLVSSVNKDIKETYHSRAPSVQLLGEFEVGEISSSLKSHALKSRMKDEVSRYSDFLDSGLGSKAYSAPVQEEGDFSEVSSVKKKRLGKGFGSNDMAGAKSEARNNVVTTPLRRSARIRSRADVASP